MIDPNFAAKHLIVKQALDFKGRISEQPYDLVLGALSWETRGTHAIETLNRPCTELILLKFSSANSQADADKESQLKIFASLCTNVDVLKLASSISYSENIRMLDDFLRQRVLAIRRPLRVLCDITCIPKSYILLLLGLGFAKNYFARFDCLYAEGAYSLSHQHSDATTSSPTEGGLISEGKWESLPVPFFEAANVIPSHRDLFVTLGGEIGLALPFIEKYEPRRLGLVMISESQVQRPDQLVQSERNALSEILSESNVLRSNIGLCDVVTLCKHAADFCTASEVDVVTALAIGSKPHALAVGIVALSQPKMEVICRLPKRYTMLDVKPKGPVVCFEIEDRFEPNAYLN